MPHGPQYHEPGPIMNRIAIAFLCPFLLIGLSCGPSDRQEVRETRTVESPEIEAKDTATQLGMPELSGAARTTPPAHPPMTQTPAQTPATQAPPGQPQPVAFEYVLPTGWEERPLRPMRDINLGIAGLEDTECFVSVIPGDGGGLPMNVNRWAAQMGAEDLSGAEIDALPRFEMLGAEGILVEISGHYTGMRGEADVPGALLLGAIAFLDTQAVFVKFTGPEGVVDAERDAFMTFCESLRFADAPAPEAAPPAESAVAAPETDPAEAAPSFPPVQPSGDFDPANLSWTAPEGWERGADRPMREATYTVADSPETECYITVLGGDGGGLGPNLSRWRAQMGNSTPYTDAELDAMPRIQMLGREAVLIALEGDYTGMTGPTQEGYALRGAVVLLGSHSVFVRMTGPAAIIEREHDNFITFCESMTHES
jgi:hypothetical protein